MRHIVTWMVFIAIAALLPQLAAAGDVEIAQQIAAQLRGQKDAAQLKGFHIGVKVENGKVWMKGQVSDARQQMLALDVARRVPNVKVVVNELHVVPSNSIAVMAANASAQPAGLAPTVAPVQAPPIAPTAVAMPMRQPASTVNFNASSVQTPVTRPAIVQPVLSQPQVATPTQAPPANYAYSAAPATTWTSGVTVSTPAATAYTSRVPSLQVSPPVATAYAGTQPSPVAMQVPAATAIRTAAVTRQPMPASAPRPIARMAAVNSQIPAGMQMQMQPAMPASAHTAAAAIGGGVPGVVHDHPNMPGYAWPSYASHPNYAAVTYPKQYSPTAWPYIGPFYPYPQVPLGWRKVSLEWDDGWWFLDFTSK